MTYDSCVILIYSISIFYFHNNPETSSIMTWDSNPALFTVLSSIHKFLICVRILRMKSL
jgi:hypothetical protein